MIEGATSASYVDSDDLIPGEPAWCCRYCRTYFPVRVYGHHPRECPQCPAATNPKGFGRYWDTPPPM